MAELPDGRRRGGGAHEDRFSLRFSAGLVAAPDFAEHPAKRPASFEKGLRIVTVLAHLPCRNLALEHCGPHQERLVRPGRHAGVPERA